MELMYVPPTRFRSSQDKPKLSFNTLSDVEDSDWGFCVVIGMSGGIYYGHYDDNCIECVCGDPRCTAYPDSEINFSCECGTENCNVSLELETNQRKDKFRLIKYKGHHERHTGGMVRIVEKRNMVTIWDECTSAMKALPVAFPDENEYFWLKDKKSVGWVYIVAPNPDLSFHRLKVGWTVRPITERLKEFRTSCPNAVLLGLWEASGEGAESAAHRVCDGRIRNSEVFDVGDPWTIIEKVQQAVEKYNAGRASLETKL